MARPSWLCFHGQEARATSYKGNLPTKMNRTHKTRYGFRGLAADTKKLLKCADVCSGNNTVHRNHFVDALGLKVKGDSNEQEMDWCSGVGSYTDNN